MALAEEIKKFEKSKVIYESVKLTFKGADGFDVYNTSIPFEYNGEMYIYGRVENRGEWARSWVRLFKNTGQDEWTLVEDSMIYQLEDPYIAVIDDELVLGGTHVRYSQSEVDTFLAIFIKGRTSIIYIISQQGHNK